MIVAMVMLMVVMVVMVGDGHGGCCGVVLMAMTVMAMDDHDV